MFSFCLDALWRFLMLYGTLSAAFGVQSPYLPSLLDSHYLPPHAIALVLAAGTGIRLVAGPAAGRLADGLDAPKAVLIVCSAAAAWIALGYLGATRPATAKLPVGGLGALLRLPLYCRIALILGSHAMHDVFAMIRREAAGISPATAGLLWSLSVAAEVIVFRIIGRPLLDRL